MKEEKKELIAEILGEISDEYIEEAVIGLERERVSIVQRKRWIAVAAACLCVVTAMLFLWDLPMFTEDGGRSGGGKVAVRETDPPQKGVTIPEMEVDLNSSGSERGLAIPFVIYKGSVYLADVSASVVQEDLRLDTYLGDATGMIDGWAEDDGYVDFAGGATGRLYSVEGLDDSFAVALKQNENDSRAELLIKNNGITLEDGSDLYEDRLHLAENYESVEYEDGHDWYMGNGKEKKQLDASCENKVSELIELLCNGEILLRDSLSVTTDVSEDLEFVFFVHLNNRVVIPLFFMRGGYVIYPGVSDVCVKIPEDVQEEMRRMAEATGSVSDSGKPVEGIDQGEKGGKKEQGKAADGKGAGREKAEENSSGDDNVITSDSADGSLTDRDGTSGGNMDDEDLSITTKVDKEVTCWLQPKLKLGNGQTCIALLCSRKDASKPYVIINEMKLEKKISLGNSKDLWYHDLAHSELVAEPDFDGDGTKEILVLLNEYRTLAEFRILKRDSKGKWSVLAQPKGMRRLSEGQFFEIKVNDDQTALLKVPSTGFQKKLDFSDQPKLSDYFAKQGKHAIMDLSYVSVEWTGSKLTVVFHIYANNAGDEVGMLKQDIVWDKTKERLRLGRTWYEETVWEGE